MNIFRSKIPTNRECALDIFVLSEAFKSNKIEINMNTSRDISNIVKEIKQSIASKILREVERPLLDIALEETGGNQAKCADLLGINRNTLRKKISELDIMVTRRRKLM